jgi:hypothetical protein
VRKRLERIKENFLISSITPLVSPFSSGLLTPCRRITANKKPSIHQFSILLTNFGQKLWLADNNLLIPKNAFKKIEMVCDISYVAFLRFKTLHRAGARLIPHHSILLKTTSL